MRGTWTKVQKREILEESRKTVRNNNIKKINKCWYSKGDPGKNVVNKKNRTQWSEKMPAEM